MVPPTLTHCPSDYDDEVCLLSDGRLTPTSVYELKRQRRSIVYSFNSSHSVSSLSCTLVWTEENGLRVVPNVRPRDTLPSLLRGRVS